MLHNYWLGIMALAFALAMALWIALVFNADRHPGRRQQEHQPMRDVMGGEFVASEGGRQVMPHFGDPAPFGETPERAPGTAEPGQAGPRVTVPGQGRQITVPAQGRQGTVPAQDSQEQAPEGQPAGSLPGQRQAPEAEQAQPATSGSRTVRRWRLGSRR